LNTNKNKQWVLPAVALFAVACVLTGNLAFFGTAYFSSIKIFLTATCCSLFMTIVNSQVQFFISKNMRKRFPEFSQTNKRILTWLLLSLTSTFFLMIILLFHFYKWVLFPAEVLEDGWKYGLLVCIISDVIALPIGEGTYTFNKWKENIQEGEQLKKANLQTQFEGLKNQVNPHFLFNSINTLSSLIHEDKERAEKFIDEMSNVYRYLLRNNEEELVPLLTELKFIQSYFHLLKTRYGYGIEMTVRIDNRIENYLLPPLTLQLLVENAVKHNNVLKEKPLLIEISSNTNGWLSVKNNLQKRTTSMESSKIGLSNIKEKYMLLNQPDILIKETATDFLVMLPLIENNKS
jgi:sensor histidine kinase YesM